MSVCGQSIKHAVSYKAPVLEPLSHFRFHVNHVLPVLAELSLMLREGQEPLFKAFLAQNVLQSPLFHMRTKLPLAHLHVRRCDQGELGGCIFLQPFLGNNALE